MIRTDAELFAIAAELGLSDESAAEMVAEHKARQNVEIPRYVRLGLNRASSVLGSQFSINCKKTIRYLDKHFSFTSDNVHRVAGFTVNRNKITGDWYVCA